MRPATARPDGTTSGRALHAIIGFGEVSETFIVDRMLEMERRGWEAWVGAKWIVADAFYEFPPPSRVFSPRPRDRLAAVVTRKDRRPWWWLERPIRRVRPDLIHAHFGWTAVEALGAARSHGLPMVAGFHGYDATVFPQHGIDVHDEPTGQVMPPGLYDEVFEQADEILATSRFIASKLRDLGCNRDVVVLPSGIRLELFPFRGPRPDASADELRIVFTGRLVPYKGLDVALRALAGLAELGGVNATLTVVGDGPARAESEQLAAELQIAERVTFLGALPRPDSLEEIRRADVMVVPSRTTAAGQAEGLGNVVKEALAMGLEVAVSDNGGLPEVMPPERLDELVPEGDPDALAERLLAIHELRAEWPDRAQAGRHFVRENYDWANLAGDLDAVYRRAVEAAGRPLAARASS
jgi:colanic acid/amylovoran biosynthesis glycosyltransferase